MRSLRLALRLSLRRLWRRRNLMVSLLAGLAAAVAVLASLPMYSDLVNRRLLAGQLEGASLSPFGFVWRYIGAFDGDISLAAYAPADDYVAARAPGVVGLPLQAQVRHLRSPRLQLWPDPAQQIFVSDQPLLWTALGVLSDLEPHIHIVEGSFPGSAGAGAIPVLVSLALAERAGLQAGERYVLHGAARPLDVEVAGIWQVLDEASPYWFYRPSVFDEILLTSADAFIGLAAPAFERPLAQAVWYQVYDGGRFQPGEAPALLANIRRAEAQASGILPGVRLDASPAGALAAYGQQAHLLRLLLTAFAVPILGFIVYFVALVARMIVQRGENETAVLRSRGAGRGQVVLAYLLEGALVGLAGLALGLLLGRQLALLMSHTERFLVFDSAAGSGQAAVLTPAALAYGLAAAGLCLLALLLPALQASRHTIVSFRQQQARQLGRPLWQRAFLDFVSLGVALYGLFVLRRQGAFGSGERVYDNPLLFLVPALFCLALSLLFVRLYPALAQAAAWLAARLPGVAALLTFRQLSRASGSYAGPLLLLCLTLSLAAFSASMARTLDAHLADQVYYAVGADLVLAEGGELVEVPGRPPGAHGYAFLPVADHLAVEGVVAATRLGDYRATASVGGRQTPGRLLGIDRLDLPGVAFFRDDFAAEPLGSLLNRLAARRNGLLVSALFMQQRGLSPGDHLLLTVPAGDRFVQISFVIAGALDLFPTHYPADGPVFVAHLDYLFERMDGAWPYQVWLRTDPAASSDRIISDLRARGFDIIIAQDARARIRHEQRLPQRQGLFGLLSVGFFTAALLTALGYLIHQAAGFQRRFVELGMLRALGLSGRQALLHLAGEQAALIAAGTLAGTLVGVWASGLFIPYFQAGSGRQALVPPFIVHIAWEQLGILYAIVGLMLLAALGVLAGYLARMKVFEAVKLGEAV
jgi:putative ABC transport system permease protein